MARANASDLEDVVQDVMLSVHTARANYDPSRPFIPWLKAIVSNRTVDFVRKQEQAATMQLLSDEVLFIADEAANNALAKFENVGALRKAVEQLPSTQRLAIELLKLRELSLREAAELTGESVSALKSSIHRAVGTLRTSLAPTKLPDVDAHFSLGSYPVAPQMMERRPLRLQMVQRRNVKTVQAPPRHSFSKNPSNLSAL